jgi:hypothetical protein
MGKENEEVKKQEAKPTDKPKQGSAQANKKGQKKEKEELVRSHL